MSDLAIFLPFLFGMLVHSFAQRWVAKKVRELQRHQVFYTRPLSELLEQSDS